jgi:DNA-directed RNA polymerase subunit beta'
MGRNMRAGASSSTRSRQERATHRSLRRALKVDEGDKVKRGQRIAEWDPYTMPILTESRAS